ncbi:MAG: hypothetical protein ACK414_16100, partial [Gemmobacter sp.]
TKLVSVDPTRRHPTQTRNRNLQTHTLPPCLRHPHLAASVEGPEAAANIDCWVYMHRARTTGKKQNAHRHIVGIGNVGRRGRCIVVVVVVIIIVVVVLIVKHSSPSNTAI